MDESFDGGSYLKASIPNRRCETLREPHGFLAFRDSSRIPFGWRDNREIYAGYNSLLVIKCLVSLGLFQRACSVFQAQRREALRAGEEGGMIFL